MKTFILVVSFAMFVAVQTLTVEQKGKLRNYDQKCIKDTGVDKELVKKIREGDWTSEDAKLKSFSFCMLKKSGLMTDDGKFHKDVALAKTAPEKREKAGKAIDKCLSNTGATKNAAKGITKDTTKNVANVAIVEAIKDANKDATKFTMKDANHVAIKDDTKDVTHVGIKDATKDATHVAIKDATNDGAKDATKDENAWNYSKCYHAENPDEMLF